MTDLTTLLATFGDPWLTLVLLVLAMLLLESERWWTRWRRRNGQRVGILAYVLDGLSITSAAMVVVSALALLVRWAIAAVVFAAELLAWAGMQVRDTPWLLALLVAIVALGTIIIALARGWLRRPHRTPALLSRGSRLSDRSGLSDALATTASDANGSAPRQLPAPENVEQLALAAMFAQKRETANAAVSHAGAIAPASLPQVAAMPKATSSFTPTAHMEQPVEALASMSMGVQRRLSTPAVPPPKSFLTATPVVEERRSRLSLALVALTFVALASGAIFYRQQVIGLVPALWPQTSYATSQATRSAPLPSPAVPTSAPPLSRRVKSDALNLRTAPGTDQPVLATLPHGASVVLLNETQTIAGRTWVKVRVAEQEGWVSQEFLE